MYLHNLCIDTVIVLVNGDETVIYNNVQAPRVVHCIPWILHWWLQGWRPLM